MAESLYARIGGAEAIIAAVDIFYDKVLADPLVQPFFEGIDMEKLAKKQVAFMVHAFGGPSELLGRDLREAHAQLVAKRGLGDAHFERVAELLQQTLIELGVANDIVAEAIERIGSLRNEVLNR
jgi:hemoglobin